MARESKLATEIEPTFKAEPFRYERRRQTWMRCTANPPRLWVAVDEDEIAERIDQELAAQLKDEPYQASTIKGVMQILRWRLGFTLPKPSRSLLPCLNGVLDLQTMQPRDYSPEDGFTWALPYAYDPHATCTKTREWLSETVVHDKETVELLRAYLRAILTSRVDLERYLELIGPGGRGKGTYARLAQALVGQANTDVSNLKTLEGSRFETAGLVDKKLLILTDEERFTGSVSTLKALTGEDTIRIERKHKDKAHADNLCMVLMAANEPILSPDYTSGLARRRLTVHFGNKVTTRRHLISLHTGSPTGELADELPGILNWVLEMSDEEMLRQLTTLSSTAQVNTKVTILLETNPMAAWADECLIIGDSPDDKVYIGMARRAQPNRQQDIPMDSFEHEHEWLYASYRGWMQRAGCKDGVSLTRFSALLVDLCREQLGLDQVFKPPRDILGVHLMGVRFRTTTDGDNPGLVTTAINASAVLQDPEGCMKATTQESEDSVGYVDFLNNNHHHARAPSGKFNSEKSTYPTESSYSRAPAYMQPSKSTGWPYGKRRLA